MSSRGRGGGTPDERTGLVSSQHGGDGESSSSSLQSQSNSGDGADGYQRRTPRRRARGAPPDPRATPDIGDGDGGDTFVHVEHHHIQEDDLINYYDSLSYDVNENMIWRKKQRSRSRRDLAIEELMRWVVSFFIGVLTATVAWAIDYVVGIIGGNKFALTEKLIGSCDSCFWLPFVTYVGFGTGLCLVAGVLVAFVEPVAAGSGIPEIKCYLNGIKVPHVVRIKTLFSKAVGVMFSVSGGLCVGKEGPMIHSGAVVAAGISQGKATSCAFDTHLLEDFRNDHDKRDFVAGGAAAGVSAAFGAPIGGVLFSLEEGASHWNQSLTWRTFFCSMVSTFALNILLSGTNPGGVWGSLSQPGLVSFGTFTGISYSVVEIPFFILMGAIGGLLGALYNFINTKLTLWRMFYFAKPWQRFLEVFLVSMLTALVSFLWAYFIHTCIDVPKVLPQDIKLRQFYCPEGQYNDMATIFFNSQEDAIKNLMHQVGESEFTYVTLLFFFLAYFCLACITYGIAVPSGLFVPTILCGCSYGRFIGMVLAYWFPHLGIQPSVYALIGAASFLGGVVRMTISLCVILIESVADVSYGLPIMVTIMVSKWVGDLFNEGLYDIHIEVKEVPFLGWEPERFMINLTAADVMTSPVETLPKVVRAGELLSFIKSSGHSAFPICTDTRGSFAGIILKSEVATLLRKRAFIRDDLVRYEEFLEYYPRFPAPDTIDLDEREGQLFVNLTPYMNNAPYTVHPMTPLTRVFNLFRTMGLRHIVVVDSKNACVGIITRWDLCGHLLEHRYGPDFMSRGRTEQRRRRRSGSSRPRTYGAMDFGSRRRRQQRTASRPINADAGASGSALHAYNTVGSPRSYNATAVNSPRRFSLLDAEEFERFMAGQ